MLREPVILAAIELGDGTVEFTSLSWDEYWGEIPRGFRAQIAILKKSWRAYINDNFAMPQSGPYCDAYLDLLQTLARRKAINSASHKFFLSRALGFENFVLKQRNDESVFAGATTSFRNPVFLSFQQRGIRKHCRNDPCLLPLIVATTQDKPILFYHYRKQRIIKNCDENLLFFPSVELAERPASFCGLDALKDNLMDEWDSRIKQRSSLLVDKVLMPLLNYSLCNEGQKDQAQNFRILDIGSGVGQFTGEVIINILRSKILGNRKIELSLLDMLSIDPEQHFSSSILLSGLAKVEYISSNYLEWLNEASVKRAVRYDVVFLFRILHNLSRFNIGMLQEDWKNSEVQSRYPVLEYLSDYFKAISLLFPDLVNKTKQRVKCKPVFVPQRVFNPSSLVVPGGGSLIERLSEISKGIIIEDGDLSAAALEKHMGEHNLKHVSVYDLSKMLRLSVNHMYWITQSRLRSPWPGAKIWPS